MPFSTLICLDDNKIIVRRLTTASTCTEREKKEKLDGRKLRLCSYETIKQFFCLPYVLLFRPPASRFLLLLVTSMTYRLSSSSIVQHYSSGRVGVSERESHTDRYLKPLHSASVLLSQQHHILTRNQA